MRFLLHKAAPEQRRTDFSVLYKSASVKRIRIFKQRPYLIIFGILTVNLNELNCMRFQFDPVKAKSNLKKHKVSFADAEGVFYDHLAIHKEDLYSEGELRFIGIGMGSAGQILVVLYTLRGEEIRLISARPATRREVKGYEG